MNVNKNQNAYRSSSYKPMSEINVTPFVDVMLVLLIIFMITAPLLTTGVSVDLPKANSDALPGQDEPITITINKEGKVFLEESLIEIKTLAAKLKAITSVNPGNRIFIRADENIEYGNVIEVMTVITNAGFKKVALITKQKIENKDLKQITDSGEIEKVIVKILTENAGKVEEYKSGKEKLYGYFVGQVMKATKGKANPKLVNEILKKKLAK